MTDHESKSTKGATSPPTPKGIAPLADVQTFDAEERASLDKLAQTARKYISSFSWCTTVQQQYFAGGIGLVFAIYLFDIVSSNPRIPARTWVFVGDVPMAY